MKSLRIYGSRGNRSSPAAFTKSAWERLVDCGQSDAQPI